MSPSLASSATKAGSFFSSPLWKRVFSRQQDVAGLHRGDRGFRRRRRCSRRRRRPAARSTVGDLGGDRLQRCPSGRGPWPAEMREQDHLAALVGDLGDGRRDALDAGGVGDLAVLHRHVEVDAHSTRLPFTSASIEGAERAHGRARQCGSDQLAHRDGGVGHAVGEAPFVVVPGHARAPACRPSPWSGPCGTPTSAGRG